jgi:transcriptional regulator with XRE-family HTH domain
MIVNVENVVPEVRRFRRMGSVEKHITERVRLLRERAGLSMEALAQAMGYKGASSYQRYENATLFKKTYIPLHIAEKIAKAIVGTGDPPITVEEVIALAGVGAVAAEPEESELVEKYRALPVELKQAVHGMINAYYATSRVPTQDDGKPVGRPFTKKAGNG